jgi:hypothetical protein
MFMLLLLLHAVSPAGLHQCLALLMGLRQLPQPWLALPAPALLLLPLACRAPTPAASRQKGRSNKLESGLGM